MKKVSIVGFGRFGRTLYRLLKDDFMITIYSRKIISREEFEISKDTKTTQEIADIYKSNVIFFAVPISEFENVIQLHKKYFKENHLLIDVLAVKLYPAEIFEKHLQGLKTQALLTHPMFGPDSTKNGFDEFPLMMNKFKTEDTTYTYWKDYFSSKKLNVIEMQAKEHDQLAANSLGLTQFIGRLLEEYVFKETPIDSFGTKKLLEVKEQVCNDTWQLFTDLQHYNPYTTEMRLKLGVSYDKLYNKLLPKQLNSDHLTFGIQGGKGSFNEEAILYFVNQNKITKYRIVYLYTAENVLQALHKGDIDRGQLAMHNSVGGIVDETIDAMAHYKFSITAKFDIKISHAMMIRSDADFKDIDSIMSHPQVFAQCKDTLSKKFPHFKLISGEGELIDHAMVAKQLSEKILPKNIATMGSRILAEIYNLKIVEDNLQDAKENYTSFLQVSRE